MIKMCGLKCLFIFFNLILLIAGVILLIIGAMHIKTYALIGSFMGHGLGSVAIILIAVGVIIVIVSIVGFCGVFCNNSTMLSCFICILIIMIILQLGAAFYIFRSRNTYQRTKASISDKARHNVKEYREGKRYVINAVQRKFHCCGADSSADWATSEGWANPEAVPDSCCRVETENCGQQKGNLYEKGCVWAINYYLMKNLLWIGALCVALAIAEVLGVVLGLYLCMNMKQKNYEDLG
ncbi:uncharacterized protein V6R79_009240 [Siganus canaliculatus]